MKIVSFFTIILFVYVLFKMIKTKEARMCGTRTKKEDDMFGYYALMTFVIFGIIISILFIFDVV